MKTFLKHLVIQICILWGIGTAFAAWNTLVSNGETLTATHWNDVVNKLSSLDSDVANMSFSGGFIWLWTSSPTQKLHVVGDTQIENPSGVQSYIRFDGAWATTTYIGTSVNGWLHGGINDGDTVLRAEGGSDLHIWTDTWKLTVDWGIGYVGIGTTTPFNKLHVIGAIGATQWVGAGCEVGCESGGWYSIMYPTSVAVSTFWWTTTSDMRLKEDIQPLEGSLKKLLDIQAVSYNWKNREIHSNREIGLIAQNVQESFPESVYSTEDGYLTVDYARLVSPTIQALQELAEKYKEQEKMIQALQRQNKILEQKYDDLYLKITE